MVEVHFYTDEADAGPDLTASVTVQELEMIGRARAAFLEKHGWRALMGATYRKPSNADDRAVYDKWRETWM
jgi:hypothetical protein